jgi:hypothetical protein
MAVPGASPTTVLFLDGPARVREDEAVLGPGVVELVLRAEATLPGLPVTIGGQKGVLRAAGLPPLLLRPTGALVSLPFVPYHEVRGREGRTVTFSRTTLRLEAEAVLRPGEGPLVAPQPPATAPDAEMEPDGGAQR